MRFNFFISGFSEESFSLFFQFQSVDLTQHLCPYETFQLNGRNCIKIITFFDFQSHTLIYTEFRAKKMKRFDVFWFSFLMDELSPQLRAQENSSVLKVSSCDHKQET